MRVGLLMGSFNPIHIAHIAMITECLNNNIVDKVFVVPTMCNPWKKGSDMLPFKTRVRMIELSLLPFEGKASVCDIEKTIEPPFFSYKTLNKLRKVMPYHTFSIIAGTDVVNSMTQWRNWHTDIKDEHNVICICREGEEPTYNEEDFPLGVTVIKGTSSNMAISSTMIRNMVSEGKIPYPYVTNEVFEILKKYEKDNNVQS